MLEGTGGGSLWGFRAEERSPDQRAGHLAPDITEIAAPTVKLTTAASSGAGVLTGMYRWVYARYKRMGNLGFPTDVSPVSTDLTLANKNGEVSVADWGDADFLAYFRSRNGGPFGLVFVDWDKVGAATDFSDSLPESMVNYTIGPSQDVLGTPRNLTGKNGGFLFSDIVNQKAQPSYTVLPTNKLTGLGITPETLAGPAKVEWEIKDVFALGYTTLILASLLSKPTRYQMKSDAWVAYGDAGGFDEPTIKNVYVPVRVNRWSPCSFAMLSFKGAADPIGIYHCMATDLTVSVKNGAIAEATAKGLAASFGVLGFPEATLATGDTYDTVPVIEGAPIGAAADQAVSLKVTVAPTAGQFSIQTGLGDTPSFSDTKLVDYDTTNADTSLRNRQSKGLSRLSDKVPLSVDGVPLGKSGRPVTALFAHDVSVLHADTVFKAPTKLLLPDMGSTPGEPDGTYTGFDPVKIRANGFTAAHATLFLAGQLIAIKTLDLTISAPKLVNDPTGAEAMVGVDVIRNGDASVSIKISRDLIDEAFQKIMRQHAYAVVTVVLEGDPIEISPGVFSTQKESLTLASNYGRIAMATRDVTGPGLVPEPIEIQLEQAFVVTEITASDFPNMAA